MFSFDSSFMVICDNPAQSQLFLHLSHPKMKKKTGKGKVPRRQTRQTDPPSDDSSHHSVSDQEWKSADMHMEETMSNPQHQMLVI